MKKSHAGHAMESLGVNGRAERHLKTGIRSNSGKTSQANGLFNFVHLSYGDRSGKKLNVFRVCFILQCMLLLFANLRAQNQASPPGFMNGMMNTGSAIQNNGSGQGVLATGVSDLRWTCSPVNTSGTWPAAIVSNPPPPNTNVCINWASNSPSAKWITYGPHNQANIRGCYSATNATMATQHMYFKYEFTLPANPVFYIDWQLNASDYVGDIYVNGVTAYSSINNIHRFNAASFKWCKFQPGKNTIVVHVVGMANSYPGAPCRAMGLMVHSWNAGPGNYVQIAGQPTICAGSTGNIYTALTPTLPGSITWTKPPGFTGISTTYSISLTAGPAGGPINFYVHSGGQNKTCLATGGFNVYVPPPLTITPSNTVICSGNSLTLTGMGASTFTWYAPGGIPVGNQSTVVITPGWGMNNYKLQGGLVPSGCTYTKTVNINVLMTPAVNLSLTSNVTCANQCQILHLNGSATNYTWVNASANTWTSAVVCPTVSTTYTVLGRAPNGCTSSATAYLQVDPLPIINVTPPSQTICPGQPANIMAMGATSYTWPVVGSNQPQVMVSPNNNSIYTVLGTGANGCINSATAQVIVHNAPQLVMSPQMICQGITNTLTGAGASTYTWYVGGTTPATLNNIGNVLTMSLTATTPVTLCGSVNNCSACTSATLNVGGPIPLRLSDFTICTNVSGSCAPVFAYSTFSAPVSYTWTDPNGIVGTAVQSNSIFGTPTVAVCPLVNTIYTVTADSPFGCPTSTVCSVSLATNCCWNSNTPPFNVSNSITPLTSIGGSYSHSSYAILQSFTLTSPAAFYNAEILIAPDVKITVPSGMPLLLENCHLFACGNNMWDGIEVLDGGWLANTASLTSNHSTLIEDAKIAIDLSNISVTNSGGVPPLDLTRMIFNRNRIGIRISNGDPQLDSLALGLNGCIFTCRNLPFQTFSNTPSWPNASMSNNGLKITSSATTGLASPYLIGSHPVANLKAPYQNEVGLAGIQIENFGDPNGFIAKPGVQWGYTYPPHFQGDFNLFDNLNVGVHVRDASLTTKNNYFQNTIQYITPPHIGGHGIYHEITGIMNARLSLKGSNINLDDGCQFWDCHNGVTVKNVHQCWISNCLFRASAASHNTGNIFSTQRMVGDSGICVETNRFDFTVKECQFNNLTNGIGLTTPSAAQPYDMTGSNQLVGVYAGGISFERNYFGPMVTSNANINAGEYFSNAIDISTPNPFGWTNGPPFLSFIVSNKVDRAFRGINVAGFVDGALMVSGNVMNIEDDNVFGAPADGYGIRAENNTDNLTVSDNTLQAQNSTQANAVSLVHMKDVTGSGYPLVQCNHVSNSLYGFNFEQNCMGTIWRSNVMCDNWAGLALTNNGVIGQQGGPGGGNGNEWSTVCNFWGSQLAQNQTYCQNSNPNLSPLFVVAGSPWEPTVNWMTNMNPGGPYKQPTSLMTAQSNTNDPCGNMFLPTPQWKITGSTQFAQESKNSLIFLISPNPTDGEINIQCSETSVFATIRVLDLSGDIILEQTNNGKFPNGINLSNLSPSIYILEIKAESNIVRKKVIKLK